MPSKGLSLNERLDPYPFFRRLRDADRVVRIRTAFAGEAWLITRHEDAQTFAKDVRLSSDAAHAGPGLRDRLEHFSFRAVDALPSNLLTHDPPDHTRLRRLVSKEFTPKRVNALEEQIRELVDKALDALPTDRPVDLVSGLATPVPLGTISRLLGISENFARQMQQRIDGLALLPIDDATADRVTTERAAFWEDLSRLVASKRSNPGDDLVSALIAARDNEDRLSEVELTSMVGILFGAGVETTMSMIGSGILLLLRHPEALAALVADPALIPGAVEEILRFESPITLGLIRYAATDITVGDITIPQGDLVLVGVATANHDGRRFPNPDTFDIRRDDSGHMTLGQGIHYCLGAPLARLELRTVFTALLRRFPQLALDCPPEEVVWRPAVFRGPQNLPVRLDPVSRSTE